MLVCAQTIYVHFAQTGNQTSFSNRKYLVGHLQKNQGI
jgi:hypothetical protein